MAKVNHLFTRGSWPISDCQCGNPACGQVYTNADLTLLKGRCRLCGEYIHYRADDGQTAVKLLVKRVRDVVEGDYVYFTFSALTDDHKVYRADHGNWSDGKVKLSIQNHGRQPFKTGDEYIVCFAGES